jgi:hypothetical protein
MFTLRKHSEHALMTPVAYERLVDVAGAEALCRRIEEQAVLERPSGRHLTVCADPDGANVEDCVRPALRQWVEYDGGSYTGGSYTVPVRPHLADDGEMNGGGAGALSRRIAQQQRLWAHNC